MEKSDKTCLSCTHYSKCKDPDKSFGYSCSSYRKIPNINLNSYLDDLAEEYLGDGYIASNSGLLLPNTVDPVMSDSDANKKEKQLISYLDDVLENPNPIPRDLKFDDSDLKEYPNFYEWCMAKDGANTPPFARQLAIGIHLFSEFCPRCSHPRFSSVYTVPYKATAQKVAENVTFLEYGICPKCGARKHELIASGELPEYQSFSGCLGQRSGKSAVISIIAPYIIHKFLKMQNPNRMYGLMENTVLSGTFVGLTFARAMSLLWTPVHNMITSSEWFQSYHSMMDHYSEKYGVTACVIKDTFIDYRHRRLRFYPMGPNKRTLRGDSRLLAATDEIGWFYAGGEDDEERERASGKEVYTSLDRSLKTVRKATSRLRSKGYDNIINAYNLAVSSPASPNDMIMYLTDLYHNSNIGLSVRLPTWKFNPQYDSKDDFKAEYAENYARAERDFGANPIVNENKAFSQDEVMNIFKRASGVNLIEVTTRAIMMNDITYTKPKLMKLLNNNFPSVVSLDAGATNNSFSLSLIQKTPNGIKVSALVEIQPIKNTVINFNTMYTEIIKPVCEKYNVGGVVTDRWQSMAILHRIEEELNIKTFTMTARAGHFTVFDSYHRPDPMILYPKPEMSFAEIFEASDDYREKYLNKPIAHLVHQFNTVQDINGVYDKGINQTDDNFRSVVLGINLITDSKFADKYLKAKDVAPTAALGMVGSMGQYVNANNLDANSNIGISSSSTQVNALDVGSMIGSRSIR